MVCSDGDRIRQFTHKPRLVFRMTDKVTYLRTVDIFQDLTAADLEAVRGQMRLVEYPAGHLFYMPTDEGEVLFILKSGRVQLYRMSPDGRKLIVVVLEPGTIFGHMALVGQGLHETYAQAIDDCLICVWGREAVETLLQKQPHVALRFLHEVGNRLSDAEQRLTEVTFKRLPARLAGLLLRLIGDDAALRGYTHQHLADMLGTYRETVTQILNEFRTKGMIETGRKYIAVMDQAALAEIAEEY